MLLWLNAIGASGLFTDMEKLADLMTKFGESSICRDRYIHVGKNTLLHVCVYLLIVKRYTF